jgi:ketosteroid isomerase-like protein
MTNTHRKYFALLAFAAGAIQSGYANPPSVKTNTDEQIIRDLDAKFGAAAAKNDAEACMAIYSPLAVQVANGFKLQDPDAIRKNTRAFLSAPGLVYNVVPEKIEITGAGELALDRGHVEVQMDTLQGQSKLAAPYLHVWLNDQGKWLLIYEFISRLEYVEHSPVDATTKG